MGGNELLDSTRQLQNSKHTSTQLSRPLLVGCFIWHATKFVSMKKLHTFNLLQRKELLQRARLDQLMSVWLFTSCTPSIWCLNTLKPDPCTALFNQISSR